ncbi:apoptosis-stimulating of p53 protein 2-like isoform 3-T3 [Menidia menidia]
MRYEAKMMPMFLTVYLSNNDQHFTEVPVTPETLCRDVVELCKEPGETDCHLSEMWRGSERAVGEGERMLDLLQRWGQHRMEVRFFLRHNRPPSRESGGSRGSDAKRNGVRGPPDRRMENGVATPRMDMTLAELQEMAARQQQQIESQQLLLASKEQRLRYLKQQEQRQQQQASEQEKLQRLRENIDNQEARLKKVRAIKGQVEQKRLSNGKLVEEIEQMNNLFQQKQRELVMAASKVEELGRQLESLKSGKMDHFNDNQRSVAELDRLYKELQVRNKLNQDQNSKLQQQKESLNKRNLEVASMDKRITELRDRLWKKKAALQQKENLPPEILRHSELNHASNGYPGKERASKETHLQLPSDGQAGQQLGPSRVAAVGPYIQSSTLPRGPARHDLLVKPAYPDGTVTLPAQDPPSKAGTEAMFLLKPLKELRAKRKGLQPGKLADWSSSSPDSNTNGHGPASTLPRMNSHSTSNSVQDESELKRDRKVRPFSMFEPTEAPAASLRKNQSSDDLVRDAQSAPKAPVKVPPPVPTKPKGPGVVPYGKPGLNTGTFPKAKPHTQQPQAAQGRSPLPPSQSQTLPLPSKQDTPPAATVRPFTPELPSSKDANLSKPQTLAASSIYSMYTKQSGSGKSFQSGAQGAVNRPQNRPNGFVSVYRKPVFQSGGSRHPENPYLDRRSPAPDNEVDYSGASSMGPNPSEGHQPETERTPRPLSPTKLLPFISNPYRHQSDGDLEALRKKLYNAPRPLKKRSSITEPEGPAGPNIQKLLYQKTTLAAMETTVNTPTTPTYAGESEKPADGCVGQYDSIPLSAAENSPSDMGQTVEGGQLPSHSAGASVPIPNITEQTKPPSPIPESEDIIPPPPPPHPAPRPDDALFPPPPPLLGLEDTIPNLPPPPPEGFLEEFPPYPPPPYPSGAEQETLGEDTFNMKAPEVTGQVTLPPGKRTNLRKPGSERIDHSMRVKFNPLALLLDSSLEGEFDLVQRIIYEVEDPSQPNDEGITALHNAVCAGHTEIVKFLVQFGVNVNAADSDGWTPLHCAASCNNVQVCKFLVESGAAVFAMTYSDMQTAADKCEEMEEGYTQCSQFLYGVQEKMGIMNRGVVYGLWDYAGENPDEVCFREGDCMTIIRREDEDEIDWWWARLGDKEGYIPRNLLGLYPRIKPRQRTLA